MITALSAFYLFLSFFFLYLSFSLCLSVFFFDFGIILFIGIRCFWVVFLILYLFKETVITKIQIVLLNASFIYVIFYNLATDATVILKDKVLNEKFT